jgi:hypothetical protein
VLSWVDQGATAGRAIPMNASHLRFCEQANYARLSAQFAIFVAYYDR